MNYYYQAFICDSTTLINISSAKLTSCGYPSPVEIFVNNSPVNCSVNTTTFNYIQDTDNLTFFASDIYGNIANLTRSWESLIGSFSLSYNDTVYEGQQNTLTADVTLTNGNLLTEGTLSYNGTSYSTNIVYSGGSYEISSTISAPIVSEDTNFSFGFYLTIDGTTYFPLSSNQTVTNINLSACGVNDTVLLNLSLLDEETKSSIFGDIELNAEIFSKLSGVEVESINLSFENVSYAEICLYPQIAYPNYLLDGEIRYSSDDHVSEFYNLQKADLEDYPKNISLFDLASNDSTEFLIIYQDDDILPVEEAIIQLQRKYISEGIYETVEAPITSNGGTAVVHIDLNTNMYRATVVKDGVVLNEFDNLVFQCQSELTGECEQILLGEIDPTNNIDYDTSRDFSSSISRANNTITLTYSIPSGSASSVNFFLEQKDSFGNTTICNTTIVSSAGSIDCVFNSTIGDSYIDLFIYKDGVPMETNTYIIQESSGVDFLENNFIIVLVLLLTLAGLAITSPEWMVLTSILALMISGALWLISGFDFVVGLGLTGFLMVAAIIIILKLAKQEDR